MTSPLAPTVSNLTRAVGDFVRSENSAASNARSQNQPAPNSGRGPEIGDLLTTGAPAGFAGLSSLLDTVSHSIGLLKSGISGLSAMDKLATSVRDALSGASENGDGAALEEARQRFSQLPGDIARIAEGAEFGGRNLLGEPGHTDTVQVSSISITLIYVDYTDASALASGGEEAPTDLEQILETLGSLIDQLTAHRESLAESLSGLRDDDGVPSLMQQLFPNAVGGSEDDQLTDEGAQLLALQIRQELAGTTASLTPESRLNALRFFA